MTDTAFPAKKRGLTVLLELPFFIYAGLNLIHLNTNPMSMAERQHVFFELEWSRQKRKTAIALT